MNNNFNLIFYYSNVGRGNSTLASIVKLFISVCFWKFSQQISDIFFSSRREYNIRLATNLLGVAKGSWRIQLQMQV